MHPALSVRHLTSPDLECRDTRNKLPSHLAEQNAKQADERSGFQKVILHFVNQIDFSNLKMVLCKGGHRVDLGRHVCKGGQSVTVPDGGV